jgi:hypothetical protein
MLTNMKKRSALLLSLAVVCATVAIVPQTASAAGSKVPNAGTSTDAYTAPNNTTAMSACPMSSAPAAGFSDTTATDVDCIKMFGVTQGTSATTYEPDASIPRWQMALFLHRMFVPTGLAAAGTTTVPAFTDTSGLSAEIQAAITAIASHGITTGTTATTFGPNDNVTREQMAMFLYRMGRLVKPYNTASNTGTANGVFTDGAAAADIASGSYNYSDIAGTTFEGMESIIALYNLGATGETCTSVTFTTCSTSFRPAADITRGEMATMIKGVLDHSNARPAGVSQQSTGVVAAGSVSTSISHRNADFTVGQNIMIDEFFQVRNDATATTAAASVPFNALSGLCETGAGGVGSTGTGTTCQLTTGDKVTNALGNVAGSAQTMAASTTGRWWAWTGAQGAIYIDGTTAGAFAYEASLPAAATASVYADTAKPTMGVHNADACDFGSGGAFNALVAQADGVCTYAGGTRTITVNLAGTAAQIAAGATPVAGYTIKFSDKKIDYLGQITITDTYVVSTDAAPSHTITCGADNNALVNGAKEAGTGGSYWEAHEVTVSFATAAGGTGLPTGDTGAPTLSYPDALGKAGNTINISCDDNTRAYVDTAGAGNGTMETLAISDNTVTVSSAGSLVTATATAFDQYGDGIAGVTVQFKSDTTGISGAAGGATNRGLLTTGADGTATLSAVVCTANGKVEWSTHTDNGVMATIGAVAPNAGAVEGSIVYCVSAGADSSLGDLPNANQVTTVTVSDAAADLTSGSMKICIQNAGLLGTMNATAQCTAAIAHNKQADSADGAGAAGSAEVLIEALTNTPANTNVVTATAGNTTVHTITFPVNTGVWYVTVTEENLTNAGADDLTATVAHTTPGGTLTTLDFIDDNAASGELVTLMTETVATGLGVSTPKRTYALWTLDSDDAYNVGTIAGGAGAIGGATKAQFDGANALISNLTTNVMISYRTGATTTGITSVQVG